MSKSGSCLEGIPYAILYVEEFFMHFFFNILFWLQSVQRILISGLPCNPEFNIDAL